MIRNRYLPAITDKQWWLSGGISAANCVVAYQPKGAASYAASLVNLANPGTYNAAEGTAPDWSALAGWSFIAGNSDYLSTGYNISTKTHSVVIRCSDAASGNTGMFGFYKTSNKNSIYIRPYYSSNVVTFYGSILAAPSSGAIVDEVFAVTGDARNLIAYRNGSADGSFAQTADVMENLPAFIGALNISGSAAQFATIKIQAMAIYNITITPTQVGLLTTAMNAL